MLALTGAIAVAMYFSIGRYIRSRTTVSFISYILFTYAFALLIVFIYIIGIGGEIIAYDLKTYTYFISLALIPMIGAYINDFPLKIYEI